MRKTPVTPISIGRHPGAVALLGLALALGCASPAQAYIGPGAGFAVLGSFLVVLAAIFLGGVVLLTWPVRFLLRRRRQGKAYAKSQVDRVIILGFDGLDPGIVDRRLAAGKLPHLAKLRETGTYTRLATTCPAMSPVAWSSFMTGAGPGRHGIFDFLTRDPRTYLPDLSSAQIRPPRRRLKLGRWRVPLSRPTLRLLRRSKPFWAVLGEHGIFSTVLRVPITFPPERFHGLLLSGMCAPDLRGTQGSFTFFTTAAGQGTLPLRQGSGSGQARATRAAGQGTCATGEVGQGNRATGGERIRVTWENGSARGALPGPAQLSAEGEPATASFALTPDGNGGARLAICGQQVKLVQGRFSEWTPVRFRLGPGMQASGICRFYLKQLQPELELYASPVNIDPERPALPVSHPSAYSVYLSKRLGRFATLGLAEDTWALNEGVLEGAAFLDQCQLLFAEREAMLFNALRNARQGCVVCVFDTTDRVQHMFWRDQAGGEFARAIEESYEQADAVLGKVMAELGPREALVVMSDHGFTAFRRGVNLNAWLRDNGYLTLKPGATGQAQWLREVDWANTRAYAVGLGGVYLNIKGREAQGIVTRGDAAALKAELIAKLSGLREENMGEVAIHCAHDTAAVNPGPYANAGPDLVIGYAPGYRTSWEAAQGRTGGPVFEDNTRQWSGDHCVDPECVPGVLFSNLKLEGGAGITDIAPTVLSLFGIAVPQYMEGRSLLRKDDADE